MEASSKKNPVFSLSKVCDGNNVFLHTKIMRFEMSSYFLAAVLPVFMCFVQIWNDCTQKHMILSAT